MLRLHLGIAYEQESRYEEAIAEVEKALQLLRGEPVAAGPLGHVYAEAGRQGEARRILEDLMREVEQRHVLRSACPCCSRSDWASDQLVGKRARGPLPVV